MGTKQNEQPEVLELEERYHSVGCPQNEDRLEWHEAQATTGPHRGHTVEVVRCADCGGQKETPID